MKLIPTLWRFWLFAMRSLWTKMFVIFTLGWIIYWTIQLQGNPMGWLEIVVRPYLAAFFLLVVALVVGLTIVLLSQWAEEVLKARGRR